MIATPPMILSHTDFTDFTDIIAQFSHTDLTDTIIPPRHNYLTQISQITQIKIAPHDYHRRKKICEICEICEKSKKKSVKSVKSVRNPKKIREICEKSKSPADYRRKKICEICEKSKKSVRTYHTQTAKNLWENNPRLWISQAVFLEHFEVLALEADGVERLRLVVVVEIIPLRCAEMRRTH